MSAVPRRWTVPRMLLLVLVASGVAGMHTMGHPSDHHVGVSRVASHTAVAVDVHADGADISMAGMDVAGVDLAVLPRSGGGLDPSEVCLAILTALGLAALIACALLAVRRANGGAAPVPAVLAGLGRGPPPRPALGLVLADLSVLRR